MPIEPILEYLKISPEASYRAVYESLKIYAEPNFFEGCSESDKFLSMFCTVLHPLICPFLAEWKVRCSILIGLITAKPKKYKPEHWYYEFLKACNTSPQTRAVAFVLERNFRQILDEYEVITAQLLKPAVRSNADDFIDPADTPTKPRPQSMFGKYPCMFILIL